MTLGLNNTLTTETFSTDSVDVSVREHVDLIVGTFRWRFELCVVVKKQSFSLRSRPISLSAVVVKDTRAR